MEIVDFEFILIIVVLITGLIWVGDKAAQTIQGKGKTNKKSIETHHNVTDPKATRAWVIQFSHTCFPILLFVLLVRSFIIEPYHIPTSSLEPTLLPGDFIIVNKYDYGLRIPILNKIFVDIGAPQLGDMVLFRSKSNPSTQSVKRVIGRGGDRVKYADKVLTINGRQATQTYIGYSVDLAPRIHVGVVEKRQEVLGGRRYYIFHYPDLPAHDFELVVPSNHYFVMGDNRDNSDDSRDWGFVHRRHFIGRAVATWMSWDKSKYRIRWGRIAKQII